MTKQPVLSVFSGKYAVLGKSQRRHQSGQSWWENWTWSQLEALTLSLCLCPSSLFPSRVRAKGRVELRGEGILQMERQSLNVVTETLPGVCSQPSSVVAKHTCSQQARVACKAAVEAFPTHHYLPRKPCACWCFRKQMVSFAFHVVLKWNGLLMK